MEEKIENRDLRLYFIFGSKRIKRDFQLGIPRATFFFWPREFGLGTAEAADGWWNDDVGMRMRRRTRMMVIYVFAIHF